MENMDIKAWDEVWLPLELELSKYYPHLKGKASDLQILFDMNVRIGQDFLDLLKQTPPVQIGE